MVEKDDADSQSLAIVGVFSAIVIFVLILGVQVMYYRMEKTDEYKKFVAPGSVELKAIQAEQRGALAEYKWVDRREETVTIPIERAMDLIVRDLQTQKP